VAASVLTAAAVGSSVYFLWTAWRANGSFGFPLDDPWIHLHFARNLKDFGSFSYFRNEMVTSGSTAPLYTLMLAAGFFLTNNEMILSYVLGILAHAALGLVTFAAARRLFPDVAAFGAAMLVALEPRLVHASVSGMETSLFMALLMASYLAHLEQRPRWLGALLGAALWIRPEAVLFAAVLALDAVVERSRQRHVRQEKRHGKDRPNEGKARIPEYLRSAGLVFVLAGVLYVAWNLILSGSILPNTFSAKVRYYSGATPEYPGQVISYFSSGPRAVLAAFFALGALSTAIELFRRRPAALAVPLLWTLALIVAYWITLPQVYQEGRYLMPALPFVALVAVHGIGLAVRWVAARWKFPEGWTRPAMAVVVLVPLLQSGIAASAQARSYAAISKYITDRQVKTAHWINENLPPDAVVATHDIGAIGYYSGRRIVDMVGLVSPGMIPNIRNFDGLERFLASQGVTHLAVLRNWFEVSSQTPLFQTDEGAPEIMEVFRYTPYKTRFVRQDVSRAMLVASALLSQGRGSEAAALLDQAARVEPACARLRFLAGCAAAAEGRIDLAGDLFREALRLQPDHREARLALEDITHRQAAGGDPVSRKAPQP